MHDNLVNFQSYFSHACTIMLLLAIVVYMATPQQLSNVGPCCSLRSVTSSFFPGRYKTQILQLDRVCEEIFLICQENPKYAVLGGILHNPNSDSDANQKPKYKKPQPLYNGETYNS